MNNYRVFPDTTGKVLNWCGDRSGLWVIPPCYALGVENAEGRIKGALIYSEYTGGSVELTIFGPGCLKRPAIKAMFSYPFNDLGVNVFVVRCRADHEKLISLICHFGWKCVGRIPQYYKDGVDCLMFAMTRRECRFLGKVN